ncbi:MAG TPA: GNAT family N-acetyltransferase [Acidimicrobiales bacterium]|nr:GNAT family N-acetyltransferase [Acidimicrobiales bacterium]
MAALPQVIPAGPVELRRWRVAHLDLVLTAISLSLPELQRWLPWARAMPTDEEELAVLEAGEADFDADREWAYLLFENGSDEMVGGAGVHPRGDPGTVEIGYWVRSDRTGRGYATAAAYVLTEATFTHLAGVDRVEIHMDAANRASAAIPPKLGYAMVEPLHPTRGMPGQSGGGLVWVRRRPL